MREFEERFNELRGNMTQEEFAKKIGISRPTVGQYENGGRIPDIFILRLIAHNCGVSADWLIGMTDCKTKDADVRSICDYTGLSEKAVECLHTMATASNDRKTFNDRLITDILMSGSARSMLFDIFRSSIALEMDVHSRIDDDMCNVMRVQEGKNRFVISGKDAADYYLHRAVQTMTDHIRNVITAMRDEDVARRADLPRTESTTIVFDEPAHANDKEASHGDETK